MIFQWTNSSYEILYVNSLNELENNFTRKYANMTSTKDALDILEFYKNDNNQLWEQVKELHEISNKINQAWLRLI